MAQKACFYPDGTRLFADIPCSSNGTEDSVCCGPSAICLSNKLCWDGGSGFVRGSCTDAAWKSSACPQFCLKPADKAGGMKDCLDLNADSWCCLEDQTTCDCSKGNVTFPGNRSLVSTIPHPDATLNTLSSAKSSMTSSPINIVTPSSSISRSQISLSTSILYETSVPKSMTVPTSNSTNLGVAIGIPVAVLSSALLILLLWFIRFQRHSHAKIKQLQAQLDLNGSSQQTVPYEVSAIERKLEMSGESAHELPEDGVGRRQELSTELTS